MTTENCQLTDLEAHFVASLQELRNAWSPEQAATIKAFVEAETQLLLLLRQEQEAGQRMIQIVRDHLDQLAAEEVGA